MTDIGTMLRDQIRGVWHSGRVPALITPSGRGSVGQVIENPVGPDLVQQLAESGLITDNDAMSTELVEFVIHPDDWNSLRLVELCSLSPYTGCEFFSGVPIDYREVKVPAMLLGPPRHVVSA